MRVGGVVAGEAARCPTAVANRALVALSERTAIIKQ
jgi:hypothetical protein